MSDTVSKSDYDRLSVQFATLQREVEQLRAKPSEEQIFQAIYANPVGVLRGKGFNDGQIEHVRQVLIADKLGPNAPLGMQVAAHQGPMMAQFQELAGIVKSLADKVDKTQTGHTQYTEREKFKSAISNTSKDSYLAKAYAKNPEKWITALASHGGTAEDFIAKQEAELKEVAEALGVQAAPAGAPAASENAENKGEGKNTTIVSAQSGLLKDVPVPKPGAAPGAWSKDVYAQTKAKLVAEANKQPGDR